MTEAKAVDKLIDLLLLQVKETNHVYVPNSFRQLEIRWQKLQYMRMWDGFKSLYLANFSESLPKSPSV